MYEVLRTEYPVNDHVFFPMGVRHTAHKSHKTVCHSDVWRKEPEMEDEIYLGVF